eukprot:CAMPEP_0174258240 /NCGR_PEP_ID=MMETSP0439-20130205/7274_1 /TAXON_ID=0 /ORGANISM="Stereomyxa ramosa, Strain Chinc5" /LENGTH=855 /DNA_ID=CAMNT_0015341679 /DNA_START=118 /DNA_END=2685 /DNA_ORIENTATION=-
MELMEELVRKVSVKMNDFYYNDMPKPNEIKNLERDEDTWFLDLEDDLYPYDLLHSRSVTIWMCGKSYSVSGNKSHDKFLEEFQKIYLFTFRKGFPSITNEWLKIQSDAGWGCMMRTGQMLLAAAFKKYYEMENQKTQETHLLTFYEILSLFGDDFGCPYSIHNIALTGKELFNKQIGEELGPATVSQVLKKLVEQRSAWHFNLKVHVSMDGCVYYTEVQQICTGCAPPKIHSPDFTSTDTSPNHPSPPSSSFSRFVPSSSFMSSLQSFLDFSRFTSYDDHFMPDNSLTCPDAYIITDFDCPDTEVHHGDTRNTQDLGSNSNGNNNNNNDDDNNDNNYDNNENQLSTVHKISHNDKNTKSTNKYFNFNAAYKFTRNNNKVEGNRKKNKENNPEQNKEKAIRKKDCTEKKKRTNAEKPKTKEPFGNKETQPETHTHEQPSQDKIKQNQRENLDKKVHTAKPIKIERQKENETRKMDCVGEKKSKSAEKYIKEQSERKESNDTKDKPKNQVTDKTKEKDTNKNEKNKKNGTQEKKKEQKDIETDKVKEMDTHKNRNNEKNEETKEKDNREKTLDHKAKEKYTNQEEKEENTEKDVETKEKENMEKALENTAKEKDTNQEENENTEKDVEIKEKENVEKALENKAKEKDINQEENVGKALENNAKEKDISQEENVEKALENKAKEKDTNQEEKKEEETEEKEWSSVVILVPLRLGLSVVKRHYVDCLKQVFHFPQSLGIAGGRSGSSYYIVGYKGDKLLYLDPHKVQNSIFGGMRTRKNLASVEETYHPDVPLLLDFTELDPSLSLIFYCHDKADFDDFYHRVETWQKMEEPIFTVTDLKPQEQRTTMHTTVEDDFILM